MYSIDSSTVRIFCIFVSVAMRVVFGSDATGGDGGERKRTRNQEKSCYIANWELCYPRFSVGVHCCFTR